MTEVDPGPFGKLCQPAHVVDDGALEFMPAAGWRLAGRGVLQTLVRVELGAVGRQVEDLDLFLALGQPVPHRAGPMEGQVIPDQESLAWVSWRRRPRKRIRFGAVAAPSRTIQRNSPPPGSTARRADRVRRAYAGYQSADLCFLPGLEKPSRAGPRGRLANPARPCAAKRRQMLNSPVRVRPTCATKASYVRPLSRSPTTCRQRSSCAAPGSLRMSTRFIPPH